jgi:hypothetical protein
MLDASFATILDGEKRVLQAVYVAGGWKTYRIAT